jgi:hypothetical protein
VLNHRKCPTRIENISSRQQHQGKYQMKEFLEHIKKIAIADSRLFLEPYMMIGRFIRKLFRIVLSRLQRSKKNDGKGDGQ